MDMAMTTCRECGNAVSSEAKVCPHCGIDAPGSAPVVTAPKARPGVTVARRNQKLTEQQFTSPKSYLYALVFLIICVFFIFKITGSISSSGSRVASTGDAACRLNLTCWGEKHVVAATVHCQRSIESLASYDYRWVDGVLDVKFSHYQWHDKKKGKLTYQGDKIKFQNGFGAWQPHIYECDYDPDRKMVIGSRSRPGQLAH